MFAFSRLILKIFESRYLIRVMALRDVKARYTASVLGIFWSVLQPTVMVFIYWFVFSLGLKLRPTGDTPFLVWFFCAFVPWTTFTEMVLTSTGAITANASLVKRTTFPSEIFPFIYVVSSGIGHLIMLGILLIMLPMNGIPLDWYAFQFLYYWGAMTVLMIGLGWLFSALNAAMRDVAQLVGLLMQVWFWGTPIIWSLQMLPERFHVILQWNPLYYIVQGYRDSFIFHNTIWNNPQASLIFWGETLFIFVLGGLVFRRLKPEFADVL